MIDEQNQNIIDQLTLRKLDYARQLLESVNLPHTGTRPKVRERLTKALEDGSIPVSTLQDLLGELDAWGDQRIQLRRFPAKLLKECRSAAAVSRKAETANMSHLLQGTIPLSPPPELTPMRVAYEEDTSQKRLKLAAAKTRQIMVPQPDIPDHRDAQYPGVVFRPFIALLDADPVLLLDATHQIRQLPSSEIRLVARQAKTAVGGKIHYRSHSLRADIRSDPELDRSQAILPNAPGLHCNCFWEPVNGLEERVHTHVFAPMGEVSILGQIREASARYVLRRILEIN